MSQTIRERSVEAAARAIAKADRGYDPEWDYSFEAIAAFDAIIAVLMEPSMGMVNAGCATGDDWAYRTWKAMLTEASK